MERNDGGVVDLAHLRNDGGKYEVEVRGARHALRYKRAPPSTPPIGASEGTTMSCHDLRGVLGRAGGEAWPDLEMPCIWPFHANRMRNVLYCQSLLFTLKPVLGSFYSVQPGVRVCFELRRDLTVR